MLPTRVLIFIFCLVEAGCVTQKTTTTSQAGRYSEDLSVWRPNAEISSDSGKSMTQDDINKKTFVEARYTINKPLDNVLDSINNIHRERKFVDGFTIQIYSGLNREDALTAKKELTTALPEIESQVQYNQPNFRVKAGKYYNHLEAQKDFTAIRKYFPAAILIPDKISIE